MRLTSSGKARIRISLSLILGLFDIAFAVVPAYAFDPCGAISPNRLEDVASFSASLSAVSVEAVGSDVANSSSVLRLSGATRYDTMSSIASVGFSEASTVVIASGENFPDALAASALAGELGSPVLLTSGSVLSSQVEYQITRLGTKHAPFLEAERPFRKAW